MNELKKYCTDCLIKELVRRGARIEVGDNFEILTDDLSQDEIVRFYKKILILDGLGE